jgi:hypothetical protein
MDSERIDRLDTMIAEGRLIRRAWTAGHDRACLLAALSPEAGAAQTAAACPAELMPPWLAYLTPWLDDAPSADAWPHIVRRYASLARRWHVLDGRAWDRAKVGALLAIVEETRMHASDDAVALAAIDGVLGWLRRGAPESDREAVANAARAAGASSASAAREAASAAARAAADAARAATRAAADRIAAGVLDAIEREIAEAEASR